MIDNERQVVVVDAETDWGDDYALERRLWQPFNVALTLAQCQTEAEVIAAAAEAEVLVTMGLDTPITEAVIQGLARCRLIIRYGIGFDNIDTAAATAAGIVVANAAEYCLSEVSDHTLALILALTRRVVFLDRSVRAGQWGEAAPPAGPMRRLSTLTLGLVGLGRIGRQVAHKMSPLVSRIIAHDPYIGPDLAGPYVVELVSLEEVMAQADLLSIHTNLSPATHHLISAAQIARMKPTAFLINTSRGRVVDEAALIEALRAGRLAGAALDVLELEPPAQQNPLRAMDNVILTPHYASNSVEAVQDLRLSIAQAVAEVLQGYWPRHVVNPEVQPRWPLRARE